MPCQPMPFKLIPAVALALALYAVGVRADESALTLKDTGASIFSFSGYGTLGAVHSSERNADFTTSFLKPNGAGHSHEWSTAPDSLIAGQVTANFTPKLSAVLQVVAEHNYDNTYRPHVEWANVRYEITPDFSIRAGRIVLPIFLLADTRKVGYTYPWVRPPLEIYRLNPVTSSDGLDASYGLHFGELANTVQASVGTQNLKLPDGGTTSVKSLWALSNTTESGPLTTRIAYLNAKLSIPAFTSLFDAFRQFGPQGADIADRYGMEGKSVSLLALGASYDPGRWFAMGEWGRSSSHTVLGTETAWYVSAGYRFGKLTPYVTYAQARADNLTDPGLTVFALPPFLAGPATGLNGALNSVLSTKPVQNTVSAGTRWDFMKNAALKVQFDHTRIGAGSSGQLINLQPVYQPGGSLNVFSATIDFVF